MNTNEIKNSMVIEHITPTRQLIKFKKINSKNEQIMIELSKCTSDHSKNSLMNLWLKNGYLKNFIPTYWNIQTYVTDKKGNCYGRYNPQTKMHTRYEKGKLVECRPILNFDYVVEATEENKNWLIDQVIQLAFN